MSDEARSLLRRLADIIAELEELQRDLIDALDPEPVLAEPEPSLFAVEPELPHEGER